MSPSLTPSLTMEPTEEELLAGVRRRRVLAWVIDTLLLTILGVCLAFVLMLLGFVTLGLTWGLIVWIPALPLAYNALWVASPANATPGQIAMGLIVRRDEDLGPPSLGQAVIWAIGYAVTIACGAIWFLACLVTVHKRCLHDFVSGLVVVRRHVPIW